MPLNAPLCKGCGFCVKFCPVHAISITDQRNAKGDLLPACDHARCISDTGCAICARMCPEGAITIKGEEAAP